MGQGRRHHAVWRRIVLIAAAIQGITPDVCDLASTKSTMLLYPILAPDAAAAPGGDEWPDDVCALPLLSRGWLRGKKPEPTRLPGLTTAESPRQALPDDESQPASPVAIPVRFPRLILTLCRLLC
jgi:hypothetical protein